MDEKKIKNLNINFIDTINRCSMNLINKSDEEIEYEIYEQIDIGMTSFLHEIALNILIENGYIDSEIKTLSMDLRKMFVEITENYEDICAESVRKEKGWHEILKLSDLIREKKNEFDLKNKL